MTDSAQQSNILIVEDDPDTAELLTFQLRNDARSFEIARNGQEAILRTGERPPDLVIMDLMMPHLDGFETTRFLKAKFQAHFLPILVLTAKDDAQSRTRGVRFGCDDYMTKPYDRAELRSSVDALLSVGAAESACGASEAAVAEAMAGEGEETEQRVAAARQRHASARDAVVDARLKMAQLLVAAGRAEHAAGHLRRILTLQPDHNGALSLLAEVGG